MVGTGWDDDRGVSEVLGAMLLFGIVIVAIGGYQAFIVPQQNAEIEMKHDAQVGNEFSGIQASISNAAATGTTRTTSITMGTRYPVRVAGINPPTISGKLATRHEGTVSMDGVDDRDLNDVCGLSPETRAITYDADYNELDDTGTLTYENGVTYRDAGDSVLLRTDQELVDGSTIRLFPVTDGDFSTGSTSSKQLRFVPGETGTRTVETNGSQLNITFPSRLDASTWVQEVLAGADNVTGVTGSDGDVTVTFESGTYTLQCTPVGIGTAPSGQGPVPQLGEDQDEVNPVGDEAVTFENATIEEDNVINITLENRGDEERRIEEIRVPFYVRDSQGNGAPPAKKVNVTGGDDPSSDVGGDYDSARYTIDDKGEIAISFFCGDGNAYKVGTGDFFAVNALFRNGAVSSYYITVPEGGSSVTGCN